MFCDWEEMFVPSLELLFHMNPGSLHAAFPLDKPVICVDED